jgi:UDP-2,3-diacylglucosamine pyrophosphatase LpxH
VSISGKRERELLLNAGAGAGMYGWVKFLAAGLRGYFTLGYQVIEIERASGARGARPVAIHHLNPLRCYFTGDNQYPVHYLGQDNEVHQLPWHDVMIIGDNLGTSAGDKYLFESAAERVYRTIIKLAAIETYVYEKISGNRPQSIYFVGGLMGNSIKEAKDQASNDADDKNMLVFRGANVVGVPGDVPVSVVEVPLAALPDGFDPVSERERADLLYANALGLDPQSLNPSLVGRQGLGSTGNQSQVLENKEAKSGLASWRQQFSHEVNQMLLDDKTLYAFKERDLRDKALEAEVAGKFSDAVDTMINNQTITPAQGTNYLVDQDVLPPEYLEEDVTGGDTLRDDQKNISEGDEETGEPAADPPAEQDQDQLTEKDSQIWHDLIY